MTHFSFTGSRMRVSSFGVDFPKIMGEGKFPMVTTPFNFIILCVFFTSIYPDQFLFDQNLNLMVRKINVSPVKLIPPLIRNAVL